MAAIDWMERVVREQAIKCEVERVDGYLFPPDNSSLDAKRKLMQLAACERIGLTDTALVDLQGKPALASLSSALRFPNAADFQPLNYLQGLARAIMGMRGRIYKNTRVVRNSSSTTLELSTGVRVTAGSVVSANKSPIKQDLAVHSRQITYRTYVVGLAVPKGSMSSVPSPFKWGGHRSSAVTGDSADRSAQVRERQDLHGVVWLAMRPMPTCTVRGGFAMPHQLPPFWLSFPHLSPLPHPLSRPPSSPSFSPPPAVPSARFIPTRRAQWWDTVSPHHYVRIARGPSRADMSTLIVGGENHPAAVLPPREYRHSYARLEGVGQGQVDHHWTSALHRD
ncbi:unnamed protein product [Closterium sp. Yama58-4]|nr:unnamed protein product [Closterium sp. Yama58-4]